MTPQSATYDSVARPAVDGLLARSRLYREFLAEHAEILKLERLESEQAGHDVGYNVALVSWVVHHRSRWLKSRHQP